MDEELELRAQRGHIPPRGRPAPKRPSGGLAVQVGGDSAHTIPAAKGSSGVRQRDGGTWKRHVSRGRACRLPDRVPGPCPSTGSRQRQSVTQSHPDLPSKTDGRMRTQSPPAVITSCRMRPPEAPQPITETRALASDTLLEHEAVGPSNTVKTAHTAQLSEISPTRPELTSGLPQKPDGGTAA